MTDTTTTSLSPYPADEPAPDVAPDGPVTTLTEMTRALQAEKTALRDAAARIETATAAHEAAIRHARNFSDEARVVFEREAAAVLAATEQAVARAASDALDVTRGVISQLPEDRMTVDPATEAVAANRAAILGPVVATAPLTQLRDDLRAALQADDRASCFLYANYLPSRLAAPPAAHEAGHPEIGQARTEIVALVARVRDDLRDTSFDPIRKLTAGVRDKAATARRPAETRRRQAAQDADFASGRRVPWPTVDSLEVSREETECVTSCDRNVPSRASA